MEPKLIYLARRKPDLTREGFTARWRQHGALGMSMPRWVNIRRYAHCDVTPLGIPGIDDSYDGIGLIWHRSPEARKRHRADNSSIAVLEADEMHTFAELVSKFCLLAREVVVQEGRSGPVKLFRFVERTNAVSKEEFEKSWVESHAPPGLGIPELSSTVLRYVQNHTLPAEHYGPWGLKSDCVDEFWFEDRKALERVHAALQGQEGRERALIKNSIWVATNEVVLYDVPAATGAGA